MNRRGRRRRLDEPGRRAGSSDVSRRRCVLGADGPQIVGLAGTLGPQRREQDDLADRLLPGDQHHQPVDPDPEPAGRGQSVLQRFDVVVVDRLGFLLPTGLLLGLRLEPARLVDRVVEL